MSKTSIVIPNWNGAEVIGGCLDSLVYQSDELSTIVVDNGSTDDSLNYLRSNYPEVELVVLTKNRGFAGGVNAGIRRAVGLGSKYIGLLNSDAITDKNWLKNLVDFLDKHPKTGIATSKILNQTGEYLDSTGENYSIWGLPFPRGRREADTGQYDNARWVFGASGGASLYRIEMLNEIGFFDEDFFAYYEDVDISFRAQLTGWKVAYVPKAVVYHQIGGTSTKIKGFATHHTLKNLPLLLWKNVPWELIPKVWPRLVIAYCGIAARALLRGQFGPFLRGIFMGTVLWPKKLVERGRIQKSRKVSVRYINSIITHDLPPNARNLRALRNVWWFLRRRKA